LPRELFEVAVRGLPTAEDSGGIRRVLRDAALVLGPQRRKLPVLVAMAVAMAMLETALLVVLARLALAVSNGDDVIAVTTDPLPTAEAPIDQVLIGAAMVLAVLLALSVPTARLAAQLSGIALERAQSRVVRAYLSAPWAHRSETREGHLQTVVNEYCTRSERLIQQVTLGAVAACGMTVILLGALIVAPVPTLVAIVGLVAIGALIRPLPVRVKRAANDQAAVSSHLASQVGQAARVSEELEAFQVDDAVADDLVGQVRRSARAMYRVRFFSRLTPTLYQYGALSFVLAGIAVMYVSGTDQLDQIGPMLLLLVRAVGYGRALQNATQGAIEQAPYIDLLEAELEHLTARPRTVGGVEIDDVAAIHFRDVSFHYPSGREVLRGVSFTIEPGETVGIIGPSGSGKTTLIQLLLRLREPTSGVVEVGTTPAADVERRAWSRHTALVPQDNKLIWGTVADNVRFFRSQYSPAQVEAAVRAAHLHEEVEGLPAGYDTWIGPGARNLSGGQRQRLGIARALLGQPGLLVLDEPTSALDAFAEESVARTLAALKGQRTMVIVAHRSTALALCDRLLEVDTDAVRSLQGDGLPVR
jgi:ATP-binding cassette subfamily B protein